jgi:hypothetical protein
VVFEGKPSVVELESFLKEMHQRRVACIGEQTLLTSGADLPADLGERLRWLHAAGLLSAVEVQELLTGLAGRGKNQSLRLQ